MKVQIRQHANGRWFLSVISHVGFANGRATYETEDDAANAARELHPDKEIEATPPGSQVTHAIRSLFDRAIAD